MSVAEKLLMEAESLDSPPRSNARILKEIARLNDDLYGAIQDYKEIRSADYGSDEDGRNDFMADREEGWDNVYLFLMDAASSGDDD